VSLSQKFSIYIVFFFFFP